MNTNKDSNPIRARVSVVDESHRYSVDEFCEICGVERRVLIELVEEGVIPPEEGEDTWVFSFRSVRRFQRAWRLRRDLDVNLPGVAVSVGLLEEIDSLRQEVQRLQNHLETLGRLELE